MTKGTRELMIEGAARLLATRGLDGTSFNEVLELTGTPRGSVYHHFPAGKEQLVGEAIDLAGDRAIALLEAKAGQSATEIAAYFLAIWRATLVRSDFTIGCSVAAVTVATESPDLLDHAAVVFRKWRTNLASLLTQGGLGEVDATSFAAVLVASAEGAVILARADRSLEPFELVAESLIARVEALSA